MCEGSKQFEKLKNIAKELLFSGAKRQVENSDGDTASNLLELGINSFENEADLKKMRYILSEPSGIRILMMTRPIEKVERRSTLQVSVFIWDVINAILFGTAAIVLFAQGWDHDVYAVEVLNCTVAAVVFTVILFYILTMIDPGYVPR